MRKLSLKKLNLESEELLQNEQLKSISGGYGPGTCCSYTYNYCDSLYPNNYNNFNYCMIGWGC